jgi:hypothetical protein
VAVPNQVALTAGFSHGVRALGGGGGLARFLVHLFIWHEIWRFGRLIWHIPKFGPVIFFVIIAVLVAGSIYGSRLRSGRGGFGSSARNRQTGSGPRDW